MNANEPAPCGVWRALVLLGMVASAPVLAQPAAQGAPATEPTAAPTPAPTPDPEPAPIPPAWPEASTVDELLRRETRAALALQQRRPVLADLPDESGPHRPSEAQPDRIDLAAIYGVGKRLHVEVLFNGQRLRYRHGRKWPDEAPDGLGAFALRSIEGTCVKLDTPDGGSGHRRVCLAQGN